MQPGPSHCVILQTYTHMELKLETGSTSPNNAACCRHLEALSIMLAFGDWWRSAPLERRDGNRNAVFNFFYLIS